MAADGETIGYSHTGAFDITHIPDALKEILDNIHDNDMSRESTLWDIIPVAPLLGEIAWDQNDPYNMLCPVYYGTQRSATGCAATAMAQIMKYHSYPPTGAGSHSYRPDDKNMGVISMDFSQSEYDWGNMTPRYGDESAEEEKSAVAKLMYDAGIAISMNYGWQSGAMSQDWPKALTEYFSYDKGVAMRMRSNYDISEWKRVISGELSCGRPVFATGFSDDGGHAFVLDGMDDKGMVHVNWGWSGMSNGYFNLNYLTPATQGTGGSNGGFNSRQFIITGIQAPQQDSETTVTLISEEGLTAPSKTESAAPVKIRLNGRVNNVGWQDSVTFFIGIDVEDNDGKIVASTEIPESITLGYGENCRNIIFPEMDLSALEDGCYTLYPFARPYDGKRHERIRDLDLTFPNYLMATVSEGHIRFENPSMSDIKATLPEVRGEIYTTAKTLLDTRVTNVGGTGYFGKVSAALTDKVTGRQVAAGETFTIDVMPGEEKPITISANFNAEPGEYNLVVVNGWNAVISEAMTVNVKECGENRAIAVKSPDFGDNDNVDPMDINATATLSASDDAIYSGLVFLYFYGLESSDIYGCVGPVFAQAEPDEEIEIHFSGVFENAVPGRSYEAVLVDGESMSYITPRSVARTVFTISKTNGIETGTAYPESIGDKYYSMDGRRLQDIPENGLYIRIKGDGTTVKGIAGQQ